MSTQSLSKQWSQLNNCAQLIAIINCYSLGQGYQLKINWQLLQLLIGSKDQLLFSRLPIIVQLIVEYVQLIVYMYPINW